MKVTKLGHCCMLIEEKGLRILTDPGAYSTAQNELKNIDVVLITHEHQDHLHIDSLKTVLHHNPHCKVISNKSVGKILTEQNIKHEIIGHEQHTIIQGLKIEGHGEKHADIYATIPNVENTSYFIGDRFFYPGDAFYNPGKRIEILALPVAGPWMKLSEAIEYAKEIRPKIAFPVHDGMLQKDKIGPVHRIPGNVLPTLGINFIVLEQGKE